MTLFDLFAAYWPAFVRGLLVTAELSLIVWVVGLVVGGALGVVGARARPLGQVMRAMGFLVGSIPVIVILMWFYYPAQALAGIIIAPFWTAVIALSVVNIFVVAETVRPALEAIPREFAMAGRVCGLTERAVFRRITFPLLMRQLLPPLLFSQVAILHATLFASLISVEEIFRVTQQINARVYRPVELFTALALLFLLICAPINALAMYLRKRYSRDFSEI